MRKQVFLLLFLIITAGLQPVKAQTAKSILQEINTLRLEARGDWQHDSLVKDERGFKGRYLNFVLAGNIGEKFSYAYRQRLNKFSKSSSFFDATDWLYINYSPVKRLTLSAGKQVAAIGGYEYDAPPIDIYFSSEFWYNIPCFQWGVSAEYALGGNDALKLQVTQSPFDGFYDHEDMYGYHLMWSGRHGVWSTLWSANLMEYAPKKYISYISLGNQLKLGRVKLCLDFLNRAANHQTYFFKDCSLVGEVSYKPKDCLNLYAKATYDVNKTHTDADLVIHKGTELTRVGGGVEFYPIKNHDVRLHADYSYAWGKNTNPNGTMQDDQSLVQVGVTWKMNLLSIRLKKKD